MEKRRNFHGTETKDKIWSRLEEHISNDIRKEYRFRVFRNFTVAAGILLMLSFSLTFLYQSFFIDVYKSVAIEKSIILKDGTKVRLLPGAELRVKKSFPGETREVYLGGNAFFQVTKSKKHPFVVHAKDFETKVLGTIFYINQTESENRVDLFEGAVEVRKKALPNIILKPQQSWTDFGQERLNAVTVLNNDKNLQQNKPSEKVIEVVNFSNISFNELIDVIQKKYKLKVSYPVEYEKKEVSGSLGKADELNSDLELIAFSIGLEAVKTRDGYKLTETK